ncbi:MAG: phosphonate ABC transporter, permease protein PhnE [Ardenticatenaceae bacterium]|nr:phosphonate ABC transporter, permease protein PhnE [Ardenticatenaceae bacterium]MCB9004757.1 phosphonate ABC transporter, permease protein PhnE [Ardenticatenaceae bacterium]
MQTSKGVSSVAAWQAALFSLLLPGSGQFVLKHRVRGVGVLVAILVLLGLVLWGSAWALLAPLLAIWLWAAWDAFQLGNGRTPGIGIPFLFGAIIVYGMGVQATEIQPGRLVSGWPSMLPYLKALTQPELFEYPTEDVAGLVPIQVPCIDPLPEPDRLPTEDPKLTINTACTSVGDTVHVSGEGFFPNFEGEIWWLNPIGDVQRVIVDGEPVVFTTDENGRFQIDIKAPLAVPVTQQPGPGETQTHTIRAEQHRPYGSLQETQTLSLVLEKIGETVALAFMATILGVIFAVPLSFLAARNLMEGNRVTRFIYTVTRTVLNVIRSIETLMWAIVFAVWVGLGPFGGTLALWLHTVAALGKLYSEAIESIDPGPIEALRAAGARGPQVAVYAVLPQIFPTFTSFTLYRWDINVRMSTVIGLVSDAGLGFLVIQWIRLNRFSAMATAIIAIVLVIAILDYVSGKLRQRIIVGSPVTREISPTRRLLTRGAFVLGFVLVFAWSWRVSQIDLVDLVRGAPDGWRLIKAFAVPDVTDRPVEEQLVTAVLPVPCGSGESSISSISGARVNLSLSCGDVGDPLIITGHELPPNTDVSVRWAFADDAYLRIQSNCCETDETGSLRLETAIHPLMEVDPASERNAPGQVVITWDEVVGGPQISESLKTVFNLSLVTLLMALLATTLGAFFAIPLSFFAARNVMGDTPLGRAVYYAFRTLFNLFRSVEPMILVLICAAWVSAGPFAGVLALALNNIPNLGKLFSETIEEIDTGPVEALTSVGAGRLQTLVYAIIPQLVPKFLAFILYQWDINIRMSTVIGFVGGGGIGQQFRLWVGLNQYSAAGTATWAIVVMVWSMDYLSARAREKLV